MVSYSNGIFGVPHNEVQAVLVRGYLPFVVDPLVVSLVHGLLPRPFNPLLPFFWVFAGGGSLSFARNWREEVILVVINYGRLIPHTTAGPQSGHPLRGTICIRGALVQGIAKKNSHIYFLCKHKWWEN